MAEHMPMAAGLAAGVALAAVARANAAALATTIG
jgi:hypothetical protein